MDEDQDGLLADWLETKQQDRTNQLLEYRANWRANPAEPYLLTFDGPLADRPHRFCGVNDVPGAECRNCKKPLLRMLTLTTAALPFSVGPHSPPRLHLLYCWTCALSYEPFSYRISPGGDVEILTSVDTSQGPFGPVGPYEGYTGVFPEIAVGLRALSKEEQELAVELHARQEFPKEHWYLTDPVHQIGGFPMAYNAQSMSCPECGETAPLFATLADNAAGQEFQTDKAKTFVNNCGVQTVFHYCADCSVMTAYHSCD